MAMQDCTSVEDCRKISEVMGTRSTVEATAEGGSQKSKQ